MQSSHNQAQIFLDVKDLRVEYGDFTAVNGISFSVQSGAIYGLLGPNGAGKTTTLSTIEGLIKPSSGKITMFGKSNYASSASKLRLGVQLQATSFQPELTITEILQLYAGLYGKALSKTDVTAALDEVGLADKADKKFAELSGGQQQRVSLLTTTLHNPDLVLLDEPTTGLDPQSRRKLWTRVEKLRDDGRGVILTTHSMEEAEAVCDRIAIIDHGQIIASGTTKQLIAEYSGDKRVQAVSRGQITLEDVFIGLTGAEIRE